MIKRTEALKFVERIRQQAESKAKRPAIRNEKEAAARANTDLNQAVGAGIVPYAEDKTGYPEWSLFALIDYFPTLVEHEDPDTGRLKYGKRDEFEIRKKYTVLYALADLRAVLRGVRKTSSTPQVMWLPFRAAVDVFDWSAPDFVRIKDAVMGVVRDAERRMNISGTDAPWRRELQGAVNYVAERLRDIENEEARRRKVFDLAGFQEER